MNFASKENKKTIKKNYRNHDKDPLPPWEKNLGAKENSKTIKKKYRNHDKDSLLPWEKKNYPQKHTTPPISIKSKLRGYIPKKSTFLNNSHPSKGPMSFAAKEKKKTIKKN